ncbi:MAG: hypothetical protein WD069_09370 [Planctomycetales bacterium]
MDADKRRWIVVDGFSDRTTDAVGRRQTIVRGVGAHNRVVTITDRLRALSIMPIGT